MSGSANPRPAVVPLPASRLVAAAFLGGTIGSLARGGAELAFLSVGLPAWGSRAAVNIVGAFLIGCLFARIAARDGAGVPAGIPHSNRAREHLWGAGFLGGFTTVSGMAWDVSNAVLQGPGMLQRTFAAFAVVAATNAVVGVSAAWIGWRLASPKHRARPR